MALGLIRLGVLGLERYNSRVLCKECRQQNEAVFRWALGSFFVSGKAVSENHVAQMVFMNLASF